MSYVLKNPDGSPLIRQEREVFGMDLLQVVKGVDLNARKLTIKGTDETVDRDGDVIRVSGWMLENYLKNPIFLWAHDYRSVPLARAEKVIKKKSPASLEFHLRFPTVGLYPFADMILNLYHERIINASSVGFIPYKWEDMTEKEKEDLPPMAQYFGGRKFTKQELLELSGCAVPSNPAALQDAVKSFAQDYNLAQVHPEEVTEYLIGKTLPIPGTKDDILEELSVECLYEDETESKVYQVPKEIENELEKEAEEAEEALLKETEETTDDEILKPYPNEHACRLKDPGQFERFRRGKRKHNGKEYSVIYGKKKDGDSWAEQAYRYKKDSWEAGEARSHCSDHGGSFEAASDSMLTLEINAVYCDGKQIPLEWLDISDVTGFLGKTEDSLNWVISSNELVIPNELKIYAGGQLRYVFNNPSEDDVKNILALINYYHAWKETDGVSDLEAKIGAVLSRKNKDKLNKAKELLEEVLAQATEEEPGEGEGDGEKRILASLGNAINDLKQLKQGV